MRKAPEERKRRPAFQEKGCKKLCQLGSPFIYSIIHSFGKSGSGWRKERSGRGGKRRERCNERLGKVEEGIHTPDLYLDFCSSTVLHRDRLSLNALLAPSLCSEYCVCVIRPYPPSLPICPFPFTLAEHWLAIDRWAPVFSERENAVSSVLLGIICFDMLVVVCGN
jgi:hypothetical protein